MGKNQSASNLPNIIKQDANGSIAFMSGSTMLMALSNTGQMSGSAPAASAVTASYADNFLVKGNLTAQTLVVQTITSSVDFVTGSTRFGSISGNTHQFTGSVLMSGSVGIGLSNPTNKLEVQAGDIKINANISSTASLYFGITGTNYGKIQYDDSNQSMFITTVGSGFSGYDLNLGTKNNIRLSILGSNGNVGIGTTSPTGTYGKLSVAGGISILDDNNAKLEIGRYSSGVPNSYIKIGTNSNSLRITNAADSADIFSITNSGSVSIGTAVIGYKLFVSTTGTGAFNLNAANCTVGAPMIDFYDTGRSQETVISSTDGTTTGTYIASYSNHPLMFGSNAGSSPTAKMTILSGGNVGIGTSSPNNSLSVRGNADFGATGIAYAGMSQYGALTFPRGQIMWSNTNTQNQLYIAANAYSNNNGVFAYRNSGQPATAIGLDNGGMSFLTAGNGTADAAISWTSALGIYNAGYVTKPSNPAFRAYYSVNSTWVLASNATFVFNATEYNIGSCYNTSNGTFTAPVAGVYQFNFYTIVLGNYGNAAISFRKNGGVLTSGFNMHFSPYYTSTVWTNVVYTTSLYLNAGDYVSMINGSGESINYHGDDWSSFSGYLVG